MTLTVLADNARGCASLVTVVVEVDDGVVAAAVLVVLGHPGSEANGAAAQAASSRAASGARGGTRGRWWQRIKVAVVPQRKCIIPDSRMRSMQREATAVPTSARKPYSMMIR